MSNNKSNSKKQTVNMVKCIDEGNNVDAYRLLEKIVRNKVAERIHDALKGN